MSTIQNQRQLLKDQKESKKRKTIITVVSVVLVVAIVLALVYFLPKKRVEGYSMGDPEAPVKVDQFSNFNCIHCINFASEQEADFIKNYVDTGKVYWTYHNYQFVEDDSSPAAEATYCAGEQGKFFDYKKLVYQAASAGYAGKFAEESLINYAKDVNLDLDEFAQCRESDRQIDVMDQGREYGRNNNVQYTPQFLVNGTLSFAADLEATINSALEDAGN